MQKQLDGFLNSSWKHALEIGLSPRDIVFHVVPSEIMHSIAAYGVPERFHHWTWGQEYFRNKMVYDLGLSRIYEVILNSNPFHAFLLENNTVEINKLVIAHCIGHADFMTNNRVFGDTYFLYEMFLNHKDRIETYKQIYGVTEVEDFITQGLSLVQHVRIDEEKERGRTKEVKQRTYEFEDLFPEKKIKSDKKSLRNEEDMKTRYEHPSYRPYYDILFFLIRFADLLYWQKDILGMLREEYSYFRPIMQTKYFNEGWAVFIHNKLLESSEITTREIINLGLVNSSILRENSLSVLSNPYRLIYKLLLHLEKKYGMEKLLEIRKEEIDSSLVRNYMDEEFIREENLYIYDVVNRPEYVDLVVSDLKWENIRNFIANLLSNKRQPEIKVVNFDKEWLYLVHEYDGIPLDLEYATATLSYIVRLWKGGVKLDTYLFDKPCTFIGRKEDEKVKIDISGAEKLTSEERKLLEAKLRGGT